MQNAKLFRVATVEQVRSLANNGADVDSRDSSGMTPLMVHTDKGEKEIVQELIRLRANIDLQDNKGIYMQSSQPYVCIYIYIYICM